MCMCMKQSAHEVSDLTARALRVHTHTHTPQPQPQPQPPPPPPPPPCTRYDAPFNERSAALLHAVTEALAHSRARPRNTAGCDRPCTLFTAAASHVATPSGGTTHELRVHTDTGPPLRVGLDLKLDLVLALRPVMTLVLEPAQGPSPTVVVRVRTCQVLNGVNINPCMPFLSAALLRCKLAQSLEPTTSAARATSAGDVLDVSMDSLTLVHSDADGHLLRQRTHSYPVLATPRRARSPANKSQWSASLAALDR
jgi:hypothetical protein